MATVRSWLMIAALPCALAGCPADDTNSGDAGRQSNDRNQGGTAADQGAGGSGGSHAPDESDAGAKDYARDAGENTADAGAGSTQSDGGLADAECREDSPPAGACDPDAPHDSARILETDEELARDWFGRERGNAAGCLALYENFYCHHDDTTNISQCNDLSENAGVGALILTVVWHGTGCDYTGEVFRGGSSQGEKVATMEKIGSSVLRIHALTSQGIAISRNSDQPEEAPDLAHVAVAYCIVSQDAERDIDDTSAGLSLCAELE